MTQWDKVLRRVLGGRSDANIGFDDLCGLLERLGYRHKIRETITSFGGLGNLK